MRKPLLVMAAILLISSTQSWAGPPLSPCEQGTLASYIDLGSDGCTIDSTLFFNFAYEARPLAGPPIEAADITVSPEESPFNQALDFAADWRVESGQSLESLIKFSVLSLRRAPFQIGGISLRGDTALAGLFGTVFVDEFASVGDLSVNVRCSEVCTAQLSDSLEFMPVQSLRVVLDAKLWSRFGTFQLSDFSSGVSELACVSASAEKQGCFDSQR